jgi:hypothetical protein
MAFVLWQGVLVEILTSTQVTTASSEVFSSVSKFSESSGGFCLPQLDPEFLATPESLVDDWSNFWNGQSASNKNVNNYTSIPRVPPCATQDPLM